MTALGAEGGRVTARIVAALNVRDEAESIADCLRSVAPHVAAVLVRDTGSADDTIARALSSGVPVQVTEDTWSGHWGDEYNQLLCDASIAYPDAEHVWILDADERVLTPPGELQRGINYSHCRLYGEIEVHMPRIVSVHTGAAYVGARHATLSSPHQRSGADVIEARAPGSAAHDPARFERDVGHFTSRLRERPTDTRAAYYLAQSLWDARRYQDAYHAYGARAAMLGGFDEERYISQLQMARLRAHWGWHVDMIERGYLDAISSRPWRGEARCELAEVYIRHGRMSRALELLQGHPRVTRDLFLVDRGAYTWRPDFLAACARRDRAAALTALDDAPRLDPHSRGRLEELLSHALTIG